MKTTRKQGEQALARLHGGLVHESGRVGGSEIGSVIDSPMVRLGVELTSMKYKVLFERLTFDGMPVLKCQRSQA